MQRVGGFLKARLKARRLDDRGVTAVLVSVLVSAVLVISAAFAVDLGQQRVVRRDMQAIADVVALDLARSLDGRAANAYSVSVLDDLKDKSVARNVEALGGKLSSGDVTWEFVKWNTTTKQWQTIGNSSTEVPKAIRASATSDTAFAFGGVTGVARGGSTRTAVGQRPEQIACYNLGSFAAALDLGNSILGPLTDFLGLDASLDLLSYKHIAGADVSLGDIALSPNIGSTDALLAPSGVKVGDLIDATIYALQHDAEAGSTDTALALTALNLLKAQAGVALDSTVNLADVVNIDAGSSAALSSELNVLELIGSSLAVANGENFLDVPTAVNLPAPLSGTATLRVSAVQGVRQGCGAPLSETSKTSQGQVTATLNVPQQNVVILPPTTTGIASGSVSARIGAITLSGGVGNAQGILKSVDHCSALAVPTNADPDRFTVTVDAGLLGINLGVPITLTGSVSIGGTATNGVLDLVNNTLNLVGNVLNLLQVLVYPQYRNFAITVAFNDLGVNLTNSTPGFTSTGDGQVAYPTNSYADGGPPVKVPNPAQPVALPNLSLPSDSLTTGTISIATTYEKKSSLLGAWVPQSNVLGSFDLSNLDTIPVVGTLIRTTLTNLVSGLNSTLVNAVNSQLATLVPLLGLSGTGADLYSVKRPDCGTTPKLVG